MVGVGLGVVGQPVGDRFGRVVGDAYLGKEAGWLTDAAPKHRPKKDEKK